MSSLRIVAPAQQEGPSFRFSTGLFVGALWILGFPILTPVGPKGLPLSRLPDLLKLSFAVVAGVGGVIALVVACRWRG